MDIFPTFLEAAGVSSADFELDGRSLLPLVRDGVPGPEREFCWEMNNQTAIRRGPWKLVLNGQFVEGSNPEDEVHLSYLPEDPGECRNLAADRPELVSELRSRAESWRAGVEERWQREWLPQATGTTGR